jgi:hypothetical protein
VSRPVEDLLRANGVHSDSPLWRVVVGLAEIMSEQSDPAALNRRERARRRIDALRAKASSTTFPAEAILLREKANELAAMFDL